MSSSLHGPRYVSWCEDSAGSPPEAPPGVSHLNHQPAASGSIPLLLLTPPETRGRQTNTTFAHPRPQLTLTKRPHHEAVTRPPHPQLNDEGEDEDSEDRRSLLEAGSFVLPRSSPVISRRHRPASWHGGGTDPSAPSSSPGHLGSKPSSSPPPPRLQEDRKPRCVSASSNLSRLLHLLPGGQQGLAEAHRGRGLPSCDAPPSSGIFKTSCELEKENAHFVVVDMVLEVLEGVKWTVSLDRCTSTTDAHQHTQEEEEEEAAYDEDEHQTETFSLLSTDSGFEDFGGDTSSTLNAEQLARQLVLEFRSSWFPSLRPQRGRRSLRSSLQELPGAGGVAASSLAEEIRLRTRMRGSLSWAPPRFQIIFTVQPTHRPGEDGWMDGWMDGRMDGWTDGWMDGLIDRQTDRQTDRQRETDSRLLPPSPRRSDVVALQHFLCAGCGTQVEPKYIRKLRYCEYLGRYFCDCCHGGSEAVIPGRILSCWDFGRYPVSDFSKQLLDSVWCQPLFDLTCVGKTLYSRVKELDKFRELQDQLLCIRKLLTACRLSQRVKAEVEQLPAHLMERPHLFSMEDLWRVKRGQLVAQAKAVLHSAIQHVENCELCLARGFICEFCRGGDVLFPFQSDVCSRCAACRSCFHKHCFVEKKCPKCSRIQSRKNVQLDP